MQESPTDVANETFANATALKRLMPRSSRPLQERDEREKERKRGRERETERKKERGNRKRRDNTPPLTPPSVDVWAVGERE